MIVETAGVVPYITEESSHSLNLNLHNNQKFNIDKITYISF